MNDFCFECTYCGFMFEPRYDWTEHQDCPKCLDSNTRRVKNVFEKKDVFGYLYEEYKPKRSTRK